MTKSEAIAAARQYLEELVAGSSSLAVCILEDRVEEIFCGWLIYYQSKRYMETGDIHDSLVGNAPILVDARDGSLHVTGTANSMEYYVRNYHDTGSPHIEGVSAVRITGYHDGAQKISATRLIYQSGVGLVIAKQMVDQVLDGAEVVIRVGNEESSRSLARDLQSVGWVTTSCKLPPP